MNWIPLPRKRYPFDDDVHNPNFALPLISIEFENVKLSIENVKSRVISSILRKQKDMEPKIYNDEHCFVIKDAFPKSKKHFLMFSKQYDISFIRQLKQKEHLVVLKHFLKVAQEQFPQCIKRGFHVVQSQDVLHMHVMNTIEEHHDKTVKPSFEDPCYFVSLENLIEQLENNEDLESIYSLEKENELFYKLHGAK